MPNNLPPPLVEAVARAMKRRRIFKAISLTPRVEMDDSAINDAVDLYWSECVDDATSAIAATLAWMKENVSEEMTDAGDATQFFDGSFDLVEVFRAMIEALEGKSDD